MNRELLNTKGYYLKYTVDTHLQTFIGAITL